MIAMVVTAMMVMMMIVMLLRVVVAVLCSLTVAGLGLGLTSTLLANGAILEMSLVG